MISFLLFDLDNTLYDELSYVQSGFNAASLYLEARGALQGKEARAFLTNSLKRDGRGRNFNLLLETYRIQNVTADELTHIYRTHTPDITLFEEAKDLLSFAKEKECTLSLITNGWREVQEKKIAALRLTNYLDSVHYPQEESMEYRKPHKKYFLKALAHHHKKPADALMIGDDEEADIKGALKVGMKTFLIKNPKDLLLVKRLL